MGSPVKFRDLTLGERMTFVVAAAPLPDFTAVPVTVVLDGPVPADGGPAPRVVLRHLNGGTDGTLDPGNAAVRFAKTSAWTAANLAPGLWTVRFLVGDDGTDQDEIGYGTKRVVRPSGGSLPTSNGGP